MHPETVPFLRAICANPADDLPRLQFADWLWDNHHKADHFYLWGEVIRHGVENPDKMMGCESDPSVGMFCPTITGEYSDGNYTALTVNYCQTCEALRLAGVPTCVLGGGSSMNSFGYQVRRGFVEEVNCRARDFVRHGGSILASCPLTFLRIRGWIDRSDYVYETLQMTPGWTRLRLPNSDPPFHVEISPAVWQGRYGGVNRNHLYGRIVLGGTFAEITEPVRWTPQETRDGNTEFNAEFHVGRRVRVGPRRFRLVNGTHVLTGTSAFVVGDPGRRQVREGDVVETTMGLECMFPNKFKEVIE